MRRAFVSSALVLLGCTDESVEGSYRLSIYNRDDGCGLGWIAGGALSSGLTIATYEDREGEHVLAVIGEVDGPLLSASQGLGGSYVGNELVLYTGDRSVKIGACEYLSGITLRAEYRPNRFVNLRGRIDYDLVVWGEQPGCSRCNSYQDIEGEQLE